MTESTVKKSNKKKAMVVTVFILILMLLLGTFLWFTATDSITNIFKMDTFDVVLTEKFVNEPVTPGAEIDKEVAVKNNGGSAVAVRIMINETIHPVEVDGSGKPIIDYQEQRITDDPTRINVTISDKQIEDYIDSGYEEVTSGVPTGIKLYQRDEYDINKNGTRKEYFAYADDGTNQLVKYTPAASPDPEKYEYAYYMQGTPIDGVHGMTGEDLDHTYITLQLTNSALWTLDATNGWYYYNKLLPGDEATEILIEKVLFAENMDNSYKGSIYTVTPKMEAIQGVDLAGDEGWNVDINETTGDVTVPRTP